MSTGSTFTSFPFERLFLDESYTTAISVDGLYYDPNFSAKSPALFLMGNEPTRGEILDAMEQVMWSNNIGKRKLAQNVIGLA